MVTKAQTHQLLIFKLGDDEYGVDIQNVQEIRNYEKTTVIPEQLPYIQGVFNLRGTIVTVLDLRIKFKLPKAPYNEFTVVIIINYNNRTIGMVVDSVSDVLTLEENQIQNCQHIDKFTKSGYLKGIGILEHRMIQVVDIKNFIEHEIAM